MPPKSQWKTALSQNLRDLEASYGQVRLALLGVGNELSPSDIAGITLLRNLKQRMPANKAVILLEGGTTPENQTGALRRFAPHLILIIDAADLGPDSDQVQLLRPEQADGFSGSTHSLPLSILAKYLEQELQCQVRFLGLQPGLPEDRLQLIAQELEILFQPILNVN